jgi:hypothetical protein
VRTSHRALLLAVGAVVLLDRFLPYGSYVLYPLTLLATWVHEMGHGLTALLLGGRFSYLEVFSDGSGAASCSVGGWRDGLVAAGGLMAPPLVGAAVLAVVRGPRRARVLLVALAVLLWLSLLIWVRSIAGWISMPLVAGLALVVAKASDVNRLFATQLVAAALALDTLTNGLHYLFVEKAVVDGQESLSDVAIMAKALGGWYLLWGVLLSVASVALLVVGLHFALGGQKNTPA